MSGPSYLRWGAKLIDAFDLKVSVSKFPVFNIGDSKLPQLTETCGRSKKSLIFFKHLNRETEYFIRNRIKEIMCPQSSA